MEKLTERKEWKDLSAHYEAIASIHMEHYFEADAKRFKNLSLTHDEILLDYSKNRLTQETLTLLQQLAYACELPKKIEQLFSGYPMNHSENRPVLHTALRGNTHIPFYVGHNDIMQEIKKTLDAMRRFTDSIREKRWRGYTGKPITDIVNVGIGGSHLGPLLTVHALSDFATPDITCHFISNIDAAHIRAVLNKLNPESTLFIISSKSFTTLETTTNANTLIAWWKKQTHHQDISAHFVAVTAAPELPRAFGIPAENIFTLWEWVGGRFSIWSSIGLPLAIMIGMEHFLAFLQGAHAMDKHFRKTEFTKNMPVMLALIGIWYINFFKAKHHAVIPYSDHLHYLRVYLQQLEMESNGKNISLHGEKLSIATSPVIFGEQGCHGQHAFHQLLHQGSHFIPVDFICVCASKNPMVEHHDILIASALSQSHALLRGKSYEDAFLELKQAGMDEKNCALLAQHKVVPGNRPSNTLFIREMSPKNLGALIALYEHKTVVQGMIWEVNSFDQWGVELGKKLLPNILQAFQSNHYQQHAHDSSTEGLIQHYKNIRGTT